VQILDVHRAKGSQSIFELPEVVSYQKVTQLRGRVSTDVDARLGGFGYHGREMGFSVGHSLASYIRLSVRWHREVAMSVLVLHLERSGHGARGRCVCRNRILHGGGRVHGLYGSRINGRGNLGLR